MYSCYTDRQFNGASGSSVLSREKIQELFLKGIGVVTLWIRVHFRFSEPGEAKGGVAKKCCLLQVSMTSKPLGCYGKNC